MYRLLAILTLGLLPVAVSAQARAPAADSKGTYLGILFGPAVAKAPEKPVPNTTANVVVTHVLPDSPAARAGLKRDDVVILYDGQAVRDCKQFAGLIHDDKPGRTVKLDCLRDGKPLTVEAKLTLGPALVLPGVAKPASNQAFPITVAAKPLPDGTMRVTVEYIGAAGKLETMVCEGSTGQIDKKVDQIPERQRPAVQAALERIRKLNQDKKEEPPKR